jgi:hypothetical protein
MPYSSKTLRKFPPITRKYAKLVGELQLLTRRAKNLVEDIWMIERDSQALYKIHQPEEKNEVKPDELEETERQILSAATKKAPK